MRTKILCRVVAVAAVATSMRLSAEEVGFGVMFENYSTGEVLSDKGATGGGWKDIPTGATVTNVLRGTVRAMDINTSEADEELTFTNTVAIASKRARYDFCASFDFADTLTHVSVDAKACGFTMGVTDKDELVLAGAAGGVWHLLFAKGFSAQLDTLYDLRLETVQVGTGTYASFFVKVGETYETLADASGCTIFELSRAADEVFSQIAFSGSGLVSDFSGGKGTGEDIAASEWTGASGGSWTNAENWSGGTVPAAGSYVRVNGKMMLVNGSESVLVSNLVAQVGEDGRLSLKAGQFDTSLTLVTTNIDTRPRAGKKFSVTVGSFMGLTPEVSCSWFRGTPQKVYATTPVSEGVVYTFQTSDYSHWFKVKASGPLVSKLEKEFYFSKLPVLYLTTDDGTAPTAAKEEHTGQIVSQCGEEKFKDKQLFSGKMTIKVRGNSTKGYPKKPWKLKLDKKTSMFGLGGDEKNKHWVLLANYNDESQLRNKLSYDFANEIGSLGMKSTWVECVLNGAWQGCYQFCEHIRIAKERVNIFDWEGYSEDNKHTAEDFSWIDPETTDITGGYLFESSNEYDELTKFVVYSGNLTLKTMLNAPEYLYTNPAMTNWCANFLQNYCNAITSADGYSAEGKHWSDYCETDSMVGYFLVMEMFGNNDASYKSRYFYKERGEKMKFGPVWDFDWGVGNDVVMTSVSPTGWKVEGSTYSFYREWAEDPWFCTRTHNIYHQKARAAFAAILAKKGPIDTAKTLLAEAGAANDTQWYRKRGFEADVENLRTHLTDRLAWLDKQFADIPTLMASLYTSGSSSPYKRATKVLPIAFANAPTNFLAQGKALHLSFTVGDSSVAKVDVFVNGLRVEKGLAVSEGTLDMVISAAAFTEAKGYPNCVSLVAYDSANAVKGRNYALVTLTDFTPEDVTPETTEGGVKIPSVPHEWICKEVASIPGLENLSSATPEEFAAAVRLVPSPSGKKTPLWQDYVAGTNPDPTAPSNTEFTVTAFTVVDGVPTFTYSPDLGTRRLYTTEGKANLTDAEWVSPAPEGAKFFRVRVALPK